MTPDQERRLEELFDAACALSPEARAAFLDRACAGDAVLRQEVESLLAAHEQAGDYLLHPAPIGAVAAQKTMSIPPLSELTGTRIGHYKLLEQIGEGGFGVVWMAEQEEPVRRRVALKIIKLGMDTKEVVARFEAERQALAMMDHPHIASVFDGGATDTGRPYFVMELVKGIPITDYCDVNKLSTRERLELFMQVCQAVQHAHQKGVIHRDLKPSNILVTVKDDRPVPKVIDFGIAKATQARLTEKTLFTRFQQWIGTPAYMSPEQAGLGNLDVDTRSDIYSLGVLLYELLTGRTPFDTQKLLAAGYDAVMRTIREEEPPKPSTRLSTLAEEELNNVAAKRGSDSAKLNRLVRGDLDWIVMKALEKDRTRRYDTSNALAQDIQLHLRAEPVLAVAPSPTYRLGKFVRRNRVTVWTALGVAVALVVATVVSLQSAFAAHKARGIADAERDKAYQARQAEVAQRTIAEASVEESRLRLVRLNTSQGVQLMDRGDWLGASLWFCDALSRAGTNASAGTANRLRLGVNLAYGPRLVRMWFHGGPINQASLSPNGRWVLTAGRDGVARIWDLASDQAVGAAMPHAAPLLGAEFSRDGRYVVTACEDRTARVWEAASGKAVSPPVAHRLPLRRALFSSDGRQVVTVSSRDQFSWSGDGRLKAQSAQSEIKRWETLSGRELPGNYGRSINLTQLVASPTDGHIAAVYADGEVCLFDERLRVSSRLGGWTGSAGPVMKMLGSVIRFGQPVEPLETMFLGQDKSEWLPAHAGLINDVAFSPDGKCLAIAGANGSLVIWDLGSNESLRILRAAGDLRAGLNPEVLQVAFSPEGHQLLALAKDGTVAFWRVPSGEVAGQLANPISGASSAVYSPDDRQVVVLRAATSGAGEARIWDVASGRAASPSLPHAGAVISACFSPDGSLLLTASLDGSVRVWNLAISVPPLPPLRDLNSPTPTQTNFPGSDHPVVALFSVDGSCLATLERGGVARLWDTSTGLPVAVIEHGHELPTAAFSHDGKRIAIAGGEENGQVRTYDAATGRRISSVVLPKGPVRRVAFSPDGRWLVTSGETEVYLWDAASGEGVPLPMKGVVAVRDLVFSLDGHWMATCAGSPPLLPDQKAAWQVQVWRAGTGDAVAPAKDIAGAQPRLDFSPDGRWLVVSSAVAAEPTSGNTLGFGTRVQILEARTGTSRGQSLELREPVSRLRFSPDSARLFLLGRLSGKLTVWDVAQAETVAVQQPRDYEFRPREIGFEGRWLLGSAQDGWRLWETASGEPITPVLGGGQGEAFQLGGECLVPGGRAVLAGPAVSPQLWPLPLDQRPLEEIARHVQLLAARELDASGSMAPLAPAGLSNLWHTVRGAIPEAFSVGTNQVALWHLHEAGQSEQAEQWFAAEFHLSRLKNTLFDGLQIRRRLAHASTQAALENLKKNP